MNTQDQRIARMTFASIYPMYVTKVEKKGRTKKELHQVIEWLTGFDYKTLQGFIKAKGQNSVNPSQGFYLQTYETSQGRFGLHVCLFNLPENQEVSNEFIGWSAPVPHRL